MAKNVITVIDGAAGSCGKAKVIGEIATDPTIKIGAAVTNCMPNAGHTYVDERGNKTIFRNIPVSSVNPNSELFIGPGSAIEMEVLMEEYKRVEKYLNGRKIYVHEMVPIIEERHKQFERDNIKSGSTFKGCGAVSTEKIIRDPNLNFFKGYKNIVRCSNDEWLDRLYKHLDNDDEYVILEGAQGCDLSLNHSGNYPYVTSRNVNVSQLLADTGISPSRHLENIMVIRPFPIRISNITKNGSIIYTGDYGNAQELTWTQINLCAKTGCYPFHNDCDYYSCNLTNEIVEELLSVSSEITLKQVFGNNYHNIKVEDVTITQALELERLFYKNNNNPRYISSIISFFGDDQYIYDLSEDTTVTKMERRIFELDINKLKNNLRINESYGLYLNFFQQLDILYKNQKGTFRNEDLEKNLRVYLNWLEDETKTEVIALGTGAKNGDCLKKKSLVIK